MKLTLEGQPLSTQHCYKYTCRGNFVSGYMDKKCKDLKEDYYWQLKSQYTGPPLKTPLRVILSLSMGTKRKADIDNYNKLVLDAMSGVIYEDDVQIQELTITKGYDKEHPRIDITIETYE